MFPVNFFYSSRSTITKYLVINIPPWVAIISCSRDLPYSTFLHHFTNPLIDVGVKPRNSSPLSNFSHDFTNPLIDVGVKVRNSSPLLNSHFTNPLIDVGVKIRNSCSLLKFLSILLIHLLT